VQLIALCQFFLRHLSVFPCELDAFLAASVPLPKQTKAEIDAWLRAVTADGKREILSANEINTLFRSTFFLQLNDCVFCNMNYFGSACKFERVLGIF